MKKFRNILEIVSAISAMVLVITLVVGALVGNNVFDHPILGMSMAVLIPTLLVTTLLPLLAVVMIDDAKK